jgi:Cd2+/Zn2+-exporting ATPase
LIRKAATAERFSNHPLAGAILKEAKERGYEFYENRGIREIPGHGLIAKVFADGEEKTIYAGNEKLMQKSGIIFQAKEDALSVIYLAENGKFIGSFSVEDRLKKDAKEAVEELKKIGIENIIMLTGDKDASAKKIARELEISDYYSGLLPHEKVQKIEEQIENRGRKVLFAGDGINDAPALSRADVGIAMGGAGSDAATSAADIVVMDDRLLGIVQAIKISRKTKKIVIQNIVFALGVKTGILVLAAFGMASMWAAVFCRCRRVCNSDF